MGEQEYLQGPVGPGGSTKKLEPPDPPITGSTTDYVESKTIPFEKLASKGDVARAPVTVRVDGDKVLHGTQRADALALLGISEEVLDEAWFYFAADNNPGGNYPDWGAAIQYQERMGWRVDVEVVQDPWDGVDGLASIDPRTARRWVTFIARKWYHTGADHMVPPDASMEITKQVPLEDTGAASASWFQVEQSEIDSTVNASEALLAARMEWETRVTEIQVALKVANAAWQGPRSEATKFKFGLEYDVIGAAWDSADAWRQQLDDLAKQQTRRQGGKRQPQERAGRRGRADVGPLRAGGEAHHQRRPGGEDGTFRRQGVDVRPEDRTHRESAARTIRRGGRPNHPVPQDHRRHTNPGPRRGRGRQHGRGQRGRWAETTAGDWLMAFTLAAAGYKISERTGKLLGTIEETHGVEFSPRVIAAATSGGDGLGQSGVKAVTNQALAAPFAIGLLADGIRGPAERRAKRFAREVLENDPNSVPAQRARARLDRERPPADPDGRFHSDPVDQQTLQKYIDEEIEKTVNRQVDPLLDFTYGVGTQAAESAHETITSADADAPSGTVAQPVGS